MEKTELQILLEFRKYGEDRIVDSYDLVIP